MTIQDLGALGEIIGAVAVLVTLVYLSIQTRLTRKAAEQATKFAELQHTDRIVGQYARWKAGIGHSPQVAELLARSRAGGALSEAEQIQTGYLFQELFFTACFSYFSSLTAGSVHAAAADVDYVVEHLREYPCALSEWHRIRHVVACLGAGFVVRVDEQIAQ